MAEQAVVSMLQHLGIGLYTDDGTPIRPGTERSDADFYLFETEARGLIAMLQEQDEPDDWMTFRAFHEALVGLGFQGSFEDLAAAYDDAYAAAPDAPIAKFVTTVASTDPEASFSRFGAWMLFLDAFVPPNDGIRQASATVVEYGSGIAAASASPNFNAWGRARDRLRNASTNMNVDPAVIARLMSILANFSIVVAATPRKVHEGHGGNGSPTDVVAHILAAPGAFVSPFTGTGIVPVNNNPGAGVTVTWDLDSTLTRHGSVDPSTQTTGMLPSAMTAYTPRREPANGFGTQITQFGAITASVPGSELINSLYGTPILGALVPSKVSGVGQILVEWHDEVMEIDLTNEYDVTITEMVGKAHTDGTDTFNGALTRSGDGRWVGSVAARAEGRFSGGAFGVGGCRTSWNATQQIMIVATEDPTRATDNLTFQFYPAAPPAGSMGRGRCPPTLRKRDGVFYAPFNDLRVTTPDEGGALVVTMPPRPGGTVTVRVPSLPALGLAIDATWVVTVNFPAPP